MSRSTADSRLWTVPNDPLGAFCRTNHAALQGATSGPLKGLTFAVKDCFHIAGVPTGFGNPTWLAGKPVPTNTSVTVSRLLQAGADMIGKTHCDELCYSLTGENIHFGTPENVNAPGRIPGGSSNGSVAAVAGGIVDFAIGTDCGGSIRIPASYCGVLGIRPTHGRVSLEGVIPFGPSFDAGGWFARDADVFERVGSALMDADTVVVPPSRLLILKDAFGLVEPAVASALAPAMQALQAMMPAVEEIDLSGTALAEWFEVFKRIQASEVWGNHGAWIMHAKPSLGPESRTGSNGHLSWPHPRWPGPETGKPRSEGTSTACSGLATFFVFRHRPASPP